MAATGILAHVSKAAGYTSVGDLLKTNPAATALLKDSQVVVHPISSSSTSPTVFVVFAPLALCPSHYEIWKYCQSTSKVHALQNLRVLLPPLCLCCLLMSLVISGPCLIR